MKKTLVDFVKRAEEICKEEFMTAGEMVRIMNIAHNTFIRAREHPDTCSIQSIRKIKKFVEEHDAKNVSVKD